MRVRRPFAQSFQRQRDTRIRAATRRYLSLAGDHTGKPAALATLAELSRRVKRQLVEIVDITAGPRRAALIVKERFERDGEQATLLRALIYSIKDGRLHECWVLDAQQALVDRFLSERRG